MPGQPQRIFAKNPTGVGCGHTDLVWHPTGPGTACAGRRRAPASGRAATDLLTERRRGLRWAAPAAGRVGDGDAGQHEGSRDGGR